MSDRVIGARVLRKEDPRLVTGRGKYAADVRLPRMAHGAVLRSPHPHARLGAIHAGKAAQLPGVIAIVTAADLVGIGNIPVRLGARPSLVACLQPPLARGRVRYAGEPVAFVVAESRYVAEDAIDLIDIEWDPLPGVADAERAVRDDAPVLHDAIGGNIVDRLLMEHLE